jgi:hypothetical protein
MLQETLQKISLQRLILRSFGTKISTILPTTEHSTYICYLGQCNKFCVASPKVIQGRYNTVLSMPESYQLGQLNKKYEEVFLMKMAQHK